MVFNNLKYEKKLWKKGLKVVVGLDEAGRGSLAGPVVAGAISIEENCELQINDLKDSKKLSLKKREEIFKLIKKNKKIRWGIGQISEKVIDKINILEATKLAMKKAIKNLEKKFKKRADFLILDGNFKLNLKIPQKSIVKADEKIFSCSLASVLAKVTRDKIMEKYHKKYPKYRFDLHKGYLTKLHFKLLKKFGPSKIHRKTFGPIKTCKIKNF